MKREPGERANLLSREVIGAAIEVHRTLGPGFLESTYEEAMAVEMQLRGISYSRQPIVEVGYKGTAVGANRLDFLVGGCLVVELKAIEAILPVHIAQVRSYLRATGNQLGLLFNFNVARLAADGIKRVVLS